MSKPLIHLRPKARSIHPVLLILALAIAAGAAPPAGEDSHAIENGPVQVQMHNVMYHFSDKVMVHLRSIAGTVVPLQAGQMPVFEDKKSFRLQIAAGEVAMDAQSLANVLNSNVFTAKDTPLKDISLPPPRISGHITAIRLEGNNIVQVFGDPQKQPWMRVSAQNYMYYHGNRLQFGKLVMNDTDLLLIDSDPSDAFDFYLDHYKEQLVAGYTKTTPTFGLRVFMVDFNKLKKKMAPAARKSR
jgi:hypothetical protein